MTYLSYSGYKTYETCPLQYWHKYVNKTRTVTPENGINTLYGSTIGQVFEAFYRDKLWKSPDVVKALKDVAKPTLDSAMKDVLRQGRILDWGDEKANYKTSKSILADVLKSIPDGVRAIQKHRFMGPFMEAEMKLDFKFGRHMMGGRADFVVRRASPDKDLVIIDGKGSKHGAKYIDGKPKKKGESLDGIQLKWYSVLYREHYGVLPDALAYLYWRYQDGDSLAANPPKEGEIVLDSGISWVEFDEKDISDLKVEVLSTLDRIETTSRKVENASGIRLKEELREELFPAKAAFHCNLCAFAEVCEAGKKVVARTKRAKTSIPSGVDELTLGVSDT